MYDPFKPSVIDQWDIAAQCAIWRERALNESRRAAFYQRKAAQYETSQEDAA